MSDVLEVVYGVQEPRFIHMPAHSVRNAAKATAMLCKAMGMPLDPWQVYALEAMMGIREDGSWAAQEYGLICARQNGKSAILEARELAGLFLFGETRIIHSAHNANTAKEAFDRMRGLVERTPWLMSEVSKILASPGQQAIVLKSGAKLTYSTRTKGGARGFSAPVVIFDEAQELTGEKLAAIVPVTSSFKNRQLIFTGTVLAGATVFRGILERGRGGMSDDLGYAEWSAPEDSESDDPVGIRMANPAIGYRPGLTVEYFLSDFERWRAAGEEGRYREERLSIWPNQDLVGSVIPVDAWVAGLSGWRPDPATSGGVVGVAVSFDRKYAVVGIAVDSPRGTYVECIAQTGDVGPDGVLRAGIDWVLPYLQGLQERRQPTAVVVDQAGPASTLVGAMQMMQLPVRVAGFQDWKAATNNFVDGVIQGSVEHSGQIQLTESAQGVQWRTVGENQVYDRKTSGVNVAPIEAVTLASWGLNPDPRSKQFFVMNLADYMEAE